MSLHNPKPNFPSRRSFVESLCGGFGALGLAGMLQSQASAAPLGPHFAPKAKHVIFLFMTGGPSQVDLLDPKPALLKYQGQRPKNAVRICGARPERN